MPAEASMSLARNIATVGSGTVLSRLLAYARDAGIAALLGSGPFAEAFFAVLQLVNFFRRLLAEGALNSAFVPIWLRLAGAEDGAANANRFTIRTLLTVGCIAGAVALTVVVLAHFIVAVIAHGFDAGRQQLAALYLVLVAPYIVLAGLVAVISAALNAEHRVVAVTVSTVAFNLVLVGLLAFVLVHRVPLPFVGIWLAMAIVSAALLQLMITSAAWLAGGPRFRRPRRRVADPGAAFCKRALPGLIAAGTPQLKLIAATAIVSSAPAAVSWLYYANRLYELPLGVASVAIAAVIVPRIAASLQAGDRASYVQAQSRAYELALGLALPAATGFALLAPQIAGGLFEHGAFGARDTEAVAAALLAICAGLPGHVMEKVFAAVSFAHEDTGTPMQAALAGLAAAVLGGLALYPIFGYVGVVAAIALSAWLGALLLGGILYRRGWLQLDAGAARNLPRIVGATAIMGAVLAGALAAVDRLLPMLAASAVGRLGLLLALVALGLLAYGAAIDRLGVAKIADLIAAVRQGG
jgi:putative peptidoglycan lipid II flippase